ncbi:MAG: hypothetical protein PHI68_01230, partial [Candidatus Cloacimonetes bacterium]|nr:hypothetical protein [Candidatus Cloacimonadota bacterium]
DAYYSFIRGSGKYFFLSPLATQEQMLLPLDGSLNQFFVQELWFDFRAQMFPNLELKLSLRPALAKLKQDYFSGNPFQLSGSQLAYGIELYEGGSLISQLPVDYWIEFGFYAPNADPIARKLFNIYRSPNEDRLSFKTLGSEYDAAYFSFVSDYVYSGIAHSGVYLYTSASEDPLKNIIAYHKAKQSVQLSNSFLSWNDASARGFSHLLLDYSPRRGINHPWLSGQPYTVQGYSQKLSARFHTTSQATDSIPREFFLSFASPNAPKNLYLMNSDAAYPKLKKYEASPAYTAASYVYANGYCSLFPAFGGDIFSGSLSTAQPDNFPVLLYNKMSFDPGEYKIFLHSDSTLPASSILSVRKMSQLPDRYGVLSNQYALSQLSSAWRFTAPYAAFYSQFQPLIFIKELVGKVKARGTDYLFSIYDVDYTYRLYPYPQSSYPDGYHFGYDSGYYSFYLVYDSDYCLMRDLLPHSLATTTISTTNTRKILSLYQAQFVLPEYFSGSSLPLGTQIRLQSSAEVPGIPNALVPLRLSFLNSLQQEISPAFFSDPNALEMPLIYVPYNPNSPDDAYHLWFRDLDGTVTELTEVEEFSDNWSTEFIVIGNSALCLVNNPGWFYFTL